VSSERQKVIVRTSVIGIVANVILAAFKAFVGLAGNSLAITLDAVNNLSDALSSIVTIIGARLAGKAPDRKHPLGHGRIEYMSQLIVAAIVLYAGVTAFVESFKKILNPETPEYSKLTLIVLVSAIVVKLVLGTYVKKKGQEVNSGSLVASGSDAFFDAVLSLSVLIAAIVFLTTGVNLEHYLGLLISFEIVKSGIEMISDAVNEMLGMRVESSITKGVRATIEKDDDVYGAYDLILHNYGPEKYMGSVHVEVDEAMTAQQIDKVTRRIQEAVYRENHVVITTVGIYSKNCAGSKAQEIRESITKRVTDYDGVLQLHGFYFDENTKDIRFDIILDFDVPDRGQLHKKITEDIQKQYPGYNIHITLDADISD